MSTVVPAWNEKFERPGPQIIPVHRFLSVANFSLSGVNAGSRRTAGEARSVSSKLRYVFIPCVPSHLLLRPRPQKRLPFPNPVTSSSDPQLCNYASEESEEAEVSRGGTCTAGISANAAAVCGHVLPWNACLAEAVQPARQCPVLFHPQLYIVSESRSL